MTDITDFSLDLDGSELDFDVFSSEFSKAIETAIEIHVHDPQRAELMLTDVGRYLTNLEKIAHDGTLAKDTADAAYHKVRMLVSMVAENQAMAGKFLQLAAGYRHKLHEAYLEQEEYKRMLHDAQNEAYARFVDDLQAILEAEEGLND